VTIRLSFWLAAIDVAHALRLPRSWYLWIVAKASDATDWRPPVDPASDGAPF